MTDGSIRYDGIVLAGGGGRRLGGISKPGLAVGGRRLLDIAVDALAGAQAVIVVGDPIPTATAVTWTREDPPGGGPVAALAAALALAQSSTVVVLAADLPFVTAAAVDVLVTALAGTRSDAVAALAADDAGREQQLLGCYDTASLVAAMPADPAGAAMRLVLARLRETGRVEQVSLGGDPPVTWDCDTPDDLTRARQQA